ncbi:uncharacterized protein LOC115634384, partial [Scaptodrosophila lebanonensis]|uniref:Uncharacterized protein LOC115634384 n=1 Tax=Drosophila lebanonensis TaxID=7225 RepID=A0A6J2UI16_DROLE
SLFSMMAMRSARDLIPARAISRRISRSGVTVLASVASESDSESEQEQADSTICVLWHEGYEFQPQGAAIFVDISRSTLKGSFERDVIDSQAKQGYLNTNNLPFDDLLLKLTLSIEISHCESFIVFGSDIEEFVTAFERASMYSIWRSIYNRFVFAHEAGELEETCCKHLFFQDQPSILFVERNQINGSTFELKTNKYVGARKDQAQLLLLDRYDALQQRFEYDSNLFPDKLRDLEGRTLTIACFDYRPYVVLKYNTTSNSRDVGVSPNQDVYIDGAEMRLVMSFCEQFNCTVQIDTSDPSKDWGTILPNMTGVGCIGMVFDHKADLAVGAFYSWYNDYIYIDMSMYLVRAGVTCLVPAPKRMVSWFLPLEPFQATLWAAVLLCLGVEMLGLGVAHKSERLLFSEAKDDGWLASIKYGLIITFKLFLSQSGDSHALSFTVRVLLFACFLNDLIITSIYGGGLASILTIPSMEEAIDTVDRLRTHRLPFAASSEAWVESLRGSDDVSIQELLENFHIFDNEHLIQLATEARTGFTVERMTFGHFAFSDFLTPEAFEQMKIMHEDLYFQYSVAFVPRLWPMLERFNALIYRWHSSGFSKYWEYQVVADNHDSLIQNEVGSTTTSSLEDLDGPEALGMSNFVGILLIWVLGISIATLVLVAELLMGRNGRCQMLGWNGRK